MGYLTNIICVLALMFCMPIFSVPAFSQTSYGSSQNFYSTEIIVSRQGPYTNLRNAVADAGPGGTIRIKAGRYNATDVEIPYDLTIIGEGRVVITSVRPVRKGLLVVLRGAGLDVQGIIFQSATSPDENGAGIRMEGRELNAYNCTFINNENGILAGGEDGSELRIIDSTFIGNGYGDGYSHGIYMSNGARILVEGSRFEGTRIGHHIKSIASQSTIVRDSVFKDGNGQPSYVVDVTGGGDMVVERNTITRAASAEQETFFNYDTSRGGRRGAITIAYNQITNEKPNASLLRNPEKAPVTLKENSYDNRAGATLALPDTRPAAGSDLPGYATASAYPVVEEKTIAQSINLDGLSPQQRRAVERMLAQGAGPKVVTHPPVRVVIELPNKRGAQQQAANAAPNRLVPAPTRPSVARQQIKSYPQVENTAHGKMNIAGNFEIITSPEFIQKTKLDEIIGIRFEPLQGSRETSNYVTFGQIFEKGSVRAGDRLALRIKGRLRAVQMDIKATHRDGSIRHAVLTVNLEGVAKDRAVDGMLVQQVATSTPLSKPDFQNMPYALEIAVSGQSADGVEFAGMVDLRTLVLSAFSEGRYWLNGAHAVETSVVKDIGPFLTVRADIRVLKDHSIRTDIIFENYKTFKPGSRDMIYSVVVKDGERLVFQENNVRHYRGSNWSRIIWRGQKAGWHVQMDPANIIKAGAVPSFALEYGVLKSTISANVEKLTQGKGLFAQGLLTKYFPTTGGRSDIGILTNWDVSWLKTQNNLAYDVMTRQARRAGAVPWHYQDDLTGHPVRLDYRPNFWADSGGTDRKFGRSAIPVDYFEGSDGGWKIDGAHKPSATYLAFLATGEAYFARELGYEAAFAINSGWPEERGSIAQMRKEIQLRTRAWTLRDVGNAAWALPDDDPMKGYFKNALEDQLNDLYKTYIENDTMSAAGETKGWFIEFISRDQTRISPWQNDYMVMVLGQEARRGNPVAAELIDWASNYHIGRFLHPDSDPSLGASAAHAAKEAQTQMPLSTWKALMAATARREDAGQTYTHDGAGYVISAMAALASIYEVTGNVQALKAISVLQQTYDTTLLYDPENDNGIYRSVNFLYNIPSAE